VLTIRTPTPGRRPSKGLPRWLRPKWALLNLNALVEAALLVTTSDGSIVRADPNDGSTKVRRTGALGRSSCPDREVGYGASLEMDRDAIFCPAIPPTPTSIRKVKP
jgi:hypothetical protein